MTLFSSSSNSLLPNPNPLLSSTLDLVGGWVDKDGDNENVSESGSDTSHSSRKHAGLKGFKSPTVGDRTNPLNTPRMILLLAPPRYHPLLYSIITSPLSTSVKIPLTTTHIPLPTHPFTRLHPHLLITSY